MNQLHRVAETAFFKALDQFLGMFFRVDSNSPCEICYAP
jgi:hypothetical protein